MDAGAVEGAVAGAAAPLAGALAPARCPSALLPVVADSGVVAEGLLGAVSEAGVWAAPSVDGLAPDSSVALALSFSLPRPPSRKSVTYQPEPLS